MPSVIHLGYVTGPATGTDFVSHNWDSPQHVHPPGNNPPPTSKQDNSQRSPTPSAQVTANHKQSTFGDFPHNYLQAVMELVIHTTLPPNPLSFVFERTLQVAQHNWNIL